MPYLGIFGMELQKTIVIFEIISLEFVKVQSFIQQKNLKFGTKNALFGQFRPEFEFFVFEINALKFSKCKVSFKTKEL